LFFNRIFDAWSSCALSFKFFFNTSSTILIFNFVLNTIITTTLSSDLIFNTRTTVLILVLVFNFIIFFINFVIFHTIIDIKLTSFRFSLSMFSDFLFKISVLFLFSFLCLFVYLILLPLFIFSAFLNSFLVKFHEVDLIMLDDNIFVTFLLLLMKLASSIIVHFIFNFRFLLSLTSLLTALLLLFITLSFLLFILQL